MDIYICRLEHAELNFMKDFRSASRNLVEDFRSERERELLLFVLLFYIQGKHLWS